MVHMQERGWGENELRNAADDDDGIRLSIKRITASEKAFFGIIINLYVLWFW